LAIYQSRNVPTDFAEEANIYLKTPLMFSVRVKDAGGGNVLGLTTRGIDMLVYGPDSQSSEYFSAGYPNTIFAAGIRYNQGITGRKHVERYQKEIELTLGNCDVQGQVMDENQEPIKNISVSVNTVGETEHESGIKVYESTTIYSEDGIFRLRNLLPGKASLTIGGSSNEQTFFERKIIDLLLQEGLTKPIIILKRK
jgi:hypothetical protein